jgi:hypothetical protein
MRRAGLGADMSGVCCANMRFDADMLGVNLPATLMTLASKVKRPMMTRFANLSKTLAIRRGRFHGGGIASAQHALWTEIFIE